MQVDNEAAFPIYEPSEYNLDGCGLREGCFGRGLTKRELFAAMALQGLAASSDFDSTHEGCAKTAMKLADALLAALDAPAKEGT